MSARKSIASLILAGASCAALYIILPISNAKPEPKNRANSAVYKIALPEKKRENPPQKDKSAALFGSENSALRGGAKADAARFKASFAADFGELEAPAVEGFADNFAARQFPVESGGFGLQVFELAGLDRIPKRISEGRVEYPRELLKAGVEGEVRALIFINPDGSAELSKIEYASDERFIPPAKKLVGTLKFERPLVGGKPARAKFTLPIPFKILK
ncbi:MAG: energy transducer TonB [Opitutales bacterium]|nr:energy transducer TonB [Opitutales bacterium]